MRLSGFFNRLIVGAAMLSTVIGASPALANGISLSSSQQSVQPIKDVALAAGGVFGGQVVASDGQPIAGAAVALQQGGQAVAQAVSDKNGAFAFQNVPGGTYVVATEGASAPYRLWAPQTAPPAADSAVMLVKGNDVVRGQFGGVSHAGVIVTTLVVGGLTWGIIEILDDDSSS